MIDALLAQLDTVLLYLFAAGALAGSALMLVLRSPMHVATALISTMVFLGGVYGLLGVHFIAAFQVLIYVGAVMVFMVYAIMLLEVRGAPRSQFSRLLLPGAAIGALLLALLALLLWYGGRSAAVPEGPGVTFTIEAFAQTFLIEYWLHFILSALLLLLAAVAAIAVIKAPRPGEDRHG